MNSRRLVLHFLSGAHAVLQCIVPPDERRVVFTSIPDHSDSSFAVYRHLLRTRTNRHITWIVADLTSRRQIESDFDRITTTMPDGHGHRLSVRSRHSWRGYVAYLRASVAFHTHGVFAFARTDHRRHIVSLWHGMPIKAIGRLNALRTGEADPHGTTHVATSDMFRYIIAASFGALPQSILSTTLPRTDSLLSAEPLGPDAAEIKKELDLDLDRHLIFWMPTYRTQVNANFVRRPSPLKATATSRTFLDDFPSGLLDELDHACGQHGCQVVIKLHPLDALNYEARERHFEHIRVLTSSEFTGSGLQLYDVLSVCDGLMSDLSSVLIDYVPTGKPIGLIGLPFDVYERALLLPLEVFVESDRFQHLVDGDDIKRFVGSVADRTHFHGDSFTALLHADHELSGSERVLRHVGL